MKLKQYPKMKSVESKAVLKEFKLDNPNFNKLNKTEQKKIISLATKEAGVLIRLYIRKEGE